MSERFIPEHRRTQYKAKNTFKPDELRRRREEQQVEIRKAKREENLAKRRGITGRDGSQLSAPGASLGAAVDSDDEGGTIESQVCKPRVCRHSSRPPSDYQIQLDIKIWKQTFLRRIPFRRFPPFQSLPGYITLHCVP